jgi:hypothetical protein
MSILNRIRKLPTTLAIFLILTTAGLSDVKIEIFKKGKMSTMNLTGN